MMPESAASWSRQDWPVGQRAEIDWHWPSGGPQPSIVAEWTGDRWTPVNSGGYSRGIAPSQVTGVRLLLLVPTLDGLAGEDEAVWTRRAVLASAVQSAGASSLVWAEYDAAVRAEAVVEREAILEAIRDVRMGDALPFNTLPDIIRGLGRQRDWQRELRDHVADVARRLTDRGRWLNAQPGDSTPDRLRDLIAAERSEAVAGERQRIASLVRSAILADAQPDCTDFDWPAVNTALESAAEIAYETILAAGSVPVATPAEPVKCWCLGNPTVSHRRGIDGCRYAAGGDFAGSTPAAPSVGTGTPAEEATDPKRCPKCRHADHGSWCPNMASDNDCGCTWDADAESPAEGVSGGSGHDERQEPARWHPGDLVELDNESIWLLQHDLSGILIRGEWVPGDMEVVLGRARLLHRNNVWAHRDELLARVEHLTDEVARYRAAIEQIRRLRVDTTTGFDPDADLNNAFNRGLDEALNVLAAALGDGEQG